MKHFTLFARALACVLACAIAVPVSVAWALDGPRDTSVPRWSSYEEWVSESKAYSERVLAELQQGIRVPSVDCSSNDLLITFGSGYFDTVPGTKSEVDAYDFGDARINSWIASSEALPLTLCGETVYTICFILTEGENLVDAFEYAMTIPGVVYVDVNVYYDPGIDAFSDVKKDDWFWDSAQAVAKQGIMTGYAGTDLFGPYDCLTRAQAVTALFRLVEGDPGRITFDPENYVDDTTGFTDVADGQYYSAALNWAHYRGIVFGCEDGTFAPDRPITREEFLVMLGRADGFGAISPDVDPDQGEGVFADSHLMSLWAQGYDEWGLSCGIVLGDYNAGAGGMLRPQDPIIRAEAATMCMRYLNK